MHARERICFRFGGGYVGIYVFMCEGCVGLGLDLEFGRVGLIGGV